MGDHYHVALNSASRPEASNPVCFHGSQDAVRHLGALLAGHVDGGDTADAAAKAKAFLTQRGEEYWKAVFALGRGDTVCLVYGRLVFRARPIDGTAWSQCVRAER